MDPGFRRDDAGEAVAAPHAGLGWAAPFGITASAAS